MPESIPEHVTRLLASSIESVERLDLLLHVRAVRGKRVTARSLAGALGLPIAAAEQHLAILCGRGFLNVTIGSDLLYTYQPLCPTIDDVLAEIETLSRHRRAEIVAALGDGHGRDPVRAFADAFVLRRLDSRGSRNG